MSLTDYKVLMPGEVITITPKGHKYVCIKYHGNQSNSCLYILLKKQKSQSAMALQEKSQDHQSEKIHPLGTINVCPTIS